MAEYSKEQRVYGVFQSISEGYDSANNRISLGLQNSWKKTLTDRLTANTPRGTNILDVCCGTGDIALKMADYEQVLREMRRVVRPGGYIYCLDSFVPDSPFIRPFYNVYFRHIMPMLGGGRKYRQEYMWLYESTQKFLHRGELERMYREIGLKAVDHKNRMCGACVLVWGRK